MGGLLVLDLLDNAKVHNILFMYKHFAHKTMFMWIFLKSKALFLFFACYLNIFSYLCSPPNNNRKLWHLLVNYSGLNFVWPHEEYDFLCMDGGKMHDKQLNSAIYDLKDAKNVIRSRKFPYTEF